MLYTLGFLLSLSFVISVIGLFIGGLLGLLLGLIICILFFLVSYLFQENVLVRIHNAKKTENKEINDIIEKMSNHLKIKKPSLYIIDTRVPNSFVCGRSDNHSAIVITRGLLDLSKEEIEGVLSHQFGHIKRHDMILWGSIAVVSYIVSYIGNIFYWKWYFGNSGKIRKYTGVVFMIIFGAIPFIIIKSFITRRMEFRADQEGAYITGRPLDMASGIRKIEAISRHENIKGNPSISHLWIINPFEKNFYTKMFYNHPDTINRLHMLEGMANRGKREREFYYNPEGFFA